MENNLIEKMNYDGLKKKNVINKINVIKNIVGSLEKNIRVNDELKMQQLISCCSSMKMKISRLEKELKDAEKLNETMLNLFRQNVTIDNFPAKIQRKVQRSWHQKYDALLNLNEQSRKQIHAKNTIIKEKDYQINILQKKLIDTEK